MDKKNEVEKLLQDMKEDNASKGGVVDDILTQAPVAEPVKEEPKVEPENRQVRRLREQLQREREMGIALNERVKLLAEERQFSKPDVKVDDRLTRIFGNDTAEKVAIAKEFSVILEDYKGAAREEAIKALEERTELEREKQTELEAQESEKLDSEFERLEDEYNVNLTDKSAFRDGFIDLLTQLSPKNKDGEITEYADFDTTLKLYQNMQKGTQSNSRQKELSSRSMQKSGTVNMDKENFDANERELNRLGIRTRN